MESREDKLIKLACGLLDSLQAAREEVQSLRKDEREACRSAVASIPDAPTSERLKKLVGTMEQVAILLERDGDRFGIVKYVMRPAIEAAR